MFEISCRCCLTKTSILVSLATESTHNDNKSLLEYFNIVFGSTIKFLDKPNFICLRCSKVLQVSYHFIKMTLESAQTLRNYYRTEVDKLLGNSKENKEIKKPESEQQDSNTVLNETQANIEITQFRDVNNNFETQFKIHINKTDPKNQKLPGPIQKTQKTKQISYIGVRKPQEKIKNLKDFKCEICQKHFESRDLYEEHNKIHKGYLPFKCKMCNYYTCFSESILKHYKKDHGLTNIELKLYQTKEELSYKCLECDFECLQQVMLDKHLDNEHFIEEDKHLFITKFFKCPACHRSFNLLKSARTHYTMYHQASQKLITPDNKKHACEKCGKLYDLKTGLFLHRRICDSRDPVNCNFCKAQFSSISKYEQHLKAKHFVAIKHECEICGKVFNCSEFLTVHRKRHNERYYQCDLCSKNYINNAELKVHKQRIHAKRAQHQCVICGNIFDHLTLLRNHENKEHLKKYHKCTYCDYKSHSKFAFKVHQYKHTGKPYKCKMCSKEFVFRKHIREHCEKHHSVTITNEELAEMFKQHNGYTSRFDAFSMKNNNLEISEINELELEGELKEYGLTLKDIMDDLFDIENMNDIN